MAPPLSNMWTGIISPFTVRQMECCLLVTRSHTQSAACWLWAVTLFYK